MIENVDEFKGLLPEETITVVNKDDITEYSIHKTTRKDGLFIKLCFKSGNIIHGFVENDQVEYFIYKLQENSIYRLYIKEYKSNIDKCVCIKLLNMYGSRTNLMSYIK